MSTNTLATKIDGDIITSDDPNQFKTAFTGDIVPRNSAGAATSEEGSLGTATYPFLRAEISSGYLFAGMIIPMHTFNGTVSPGQGWFPCLGGIINETNYNAIHGAGSWDTYIGTSPLDGKYTPNLTDKYLVGAASTTQTGSVALTFVGNAAHTFSLPGHTHGTNTHRHTWYNGTGGTTTDTTYYNGSSSNVVAASSTTGLGIMVSDGTGTTDTLQAAGGSQISTSNNNAGTTLSNGTFNYDTQPESLEVIYYMRII